MGFHCGFSFICPNVAVTAGAHCVQRGAAPSAPEIVVFVLAGPLRFNLLNLTSSAIDEQFDARDKT